MSEKAHQIPYCETPVSAFNNDRVDNDRVNKRTRGGMVFVPESWRQRLTLRLVYCVSVYIDVSVKNAPIHTSIIHIY